MKVDDKTLKSSLSKAIENSVIKKEGFKDKERKFDESVDIIINLKDVNLKDPKQRIDKELILPNQVIAKKIPNLCVIASDEILLKAKKIGVDTLDSDGLVALDTKEKKDKKKLVKKYDFFVVESKLMPQVARYLARFLGPMGKMPKPFPSGYGIINNPEDLDSAIERYQKVIKVRVTKHPIVQVKVGKKSMDQAKLLENLKTVIDFIVDQMPHKFNNIKSLFLKTTMGHPYKVGSEV